jgi:hypothetical protein
VICAVCTTPKADTETCASCGEASWLHPETSVLQTHDVVAAAAVELCPSCNAPPTNPGYPCSLECYTAAGYDGAGYERFLVTRRAELDAIAAELSSSDTYKAVREAGEKYDAEHAPAPVAEVLGQPVAPSSSQPEASAPAPADTEIVPPMVAGEDPDLAVVVEQGTPLTETEFAAVAARADQPEITPTPEQATTVIENVSSTSSTSDSITETGASAPTTKTAKPSTKRSK